MPENNHADLFLLVDRIVTATTMAALVQGLLGLTEALREGLVISPQNDKSDDDEETVSLWKAFVHVLQGTHAACVGATQRDEAFQAVLRLYAQMAKQSRSQSSQYYRTWLTTPERTTWMQALVDVATVGEFQDADVAAIPRYAAYTRVLALQTIVAAGKSQPQLTQQALLQTPQAVVRLAECITDPAADDQVRTTALAELAPLIAAWPATAKLWVFAEVPQHLLRAVVVHEQGWTGGNAVTADALRCITACLQHDAKSVLLVTESADHWWSLLVQLVDLRQGQAFKYPEKALNFKSKTVAVEADDLDDLLGTGDTKKAESPDEMPRAPVPRLLPAEEECLRLVLELLRTCLQHDAVRQTVWKSQRPLMALIWDWACMGPPPPSNFPCAFSSVDLQVEVLALVAECLAEGSLLLDVHWEGLNRLLYLACTGGPGTTTAEQWHISQAAVAVVRACLASQPDLAQECVLASLAPMMDEQQIEEEDRLRAAAVPRLLQTVVENLQQTDITNDMDLRSGVGLVGSLSALGLFAGDTEAQKSLLLKLSTTSLLHDAWERLAVEWERLQSSKSHSSGKSEQPVALRQMSQTIILAILRWVGSWMTQAPLVVQGWLGDASSAQVLGELVQASLKSHGNKSDKQAVELIESIASLVLGVALVHLPKDASDCGGWTSHTIVHVLGQLPKRMTQWENVKKNLHIANDLLPWASNVAEGRMWQSWVSAQVLDVRKALIHVVAGSNSGSDDNDDHGDGDAPIDGGPSRKSLQAMLVQQAKESEHLRMELEASQFRVQAQEKQLAVWTQRVESTPTELDQMLTDYGSQITALEETIRSLRSDVESRDLRIEGLETRVKNLETIEEGLTEERDRVQDDMRALSETYSNLEDEYRRLEQRHQQAQATTEQPTTAAGEDPSGTEAAEDTINQQSQGENPDQGASAVVAGSTEMATLRAENTRLRETARQADDWMRMAVERMNTQDAQLNQANQRIHELESLADDSTGLVQTTTMAASRDEWEEKERDLSRALEHEQAARSEVELQLKAMQQDECVRMELEHALEQARNEIAVLKQEISLIQSRNDEMAREDTKTFDALVSQGQAAQEAAGAELAAATEASKTLQAENTSLIRKVEQLESSLAVYDLNEVPTLRNDLEASRLHFAAEVARKDSIIRSLEEKISAAKGDTASEAIESRDEEIEQLRLSNQAAQEWMAQAVEHHHALSEQLAELTAHKEQAAIENSVDVAAMSSKSGPNEASNSLHSQLRDKEELINILSAECDKLKSALSQKDSVVTHDLSRAFELSSDNEHVLLTLRRENEKLRQEKSDGDRRVEKAELEYEQMKSELAVLSHEYEDLQEEMGAIQRGTVSPVEQNGLEAKVKELLDQLLQVERDRDRRQAEATKLLAEWQSKYAELENRVHATEKPSGAAEENKPPERELLDSHISELRTTIDELRAELRRQDEEAQSTVSQLMASYNDLLERNNALQNQVSNSPENSSDNIETSTDVAELRQMLEEEKAAADEAINQWQASYITLQEQYDALQSQTACVTTNEAEVSVLASENASLREQLEEQTADANDVIEQWQASLDDLQKQYDELKAQHEGAFGVGDADSVNLRAEIDVLTKRLEENSADADNAIKMWESSYNQLKAERDSLLTHGDENKRNEIEVLKQQLQEESKEADLIVAQWQESYNELKQKYSLAISGEASTDVAALKVEIESLSKLLEDQTTDADNAIDQWQNAYNDLSDKYESLKKQTTLSSSENVGPDVDELQREVENLKEQLEEEKSEADRTISEWQNAYNALNEQHESIMDQRNSVLSKPLESAEETDDIQSLRKQLDLKRLETESIDARWKESYDALQSKYEDLKSSSDAIAVSGRTFVSHELDTLKKDSVIELRESELQKVVEELKKQLAENEAKAASVIRQWQESYTSLETKFDEFRKNSDLESAQLKVEIEQLKKQLADKAAEVEYVTTQWQTSYNGLRQELEALQNQHHPEDEVMDLKSRLSTLQKQIEDESAAAEIAISQWEESYLALENECSDLQEKLKISVEPSIHEAQDHNSVVAELEAEISKLQEQLASESHSADEAISQWQESYSMAQNQNEELLKSNKVLEEKLATTLAENSSLSDQISQLLSHNQEQLEELTRMTSEINTLRNPLDEVSSRSMKLYEDSTEQPTELHMDRDELVAQLHVKSSEVAELQSKIRELGSRLVEEAKEADEAVTQWEESYNEVEESRKALETELLQAKANETVTSKEMERLKAQLEEAKPTIARSEDEERLTEVVKQWQASYHALQDDYNQLLGELMSAKDAMDDAIAENTRLKEESADESRENNTSATGPLTDQAEDLKAMLAKVENERDSEARSYEGTIAQVQESYDALQADFDAIQRELDEALERVQQLGSDNRRLSTELEESRTALTGEKTKLLEDISMLKKQQEDDARESEEAINQCQENYNALEAELSSARDELESTFRMKQEWETQMTSLQGRLSELEAAMEQTTGSNERLQQQLDEMTSRAKTAEGQLEAGISGASYGENEETPLEVVEHEDECKKLHDIVKSLTEQCDVLKEEVSFLTTELEDQKTHRDKADHELDESEQIINEWRERVEELENVESRLRDELDQKDVDLKQTHADAEEAIGMWEQQCRDLEKQLSERPPIDNASFAALESELVRLKKENSKLSEMTASARKGGSAMDDFEKKKALDEEIVARKAAEDKSSFLEKKLTETEAILTARIESMQAEQARDKSSEDAKRLQDRERINELEQKIETLRNEKASAESDLDKLKKKISEQDSEIRDLFDSLNLHRTNEVASRATKIMADALRKEVDGLQKQIEQKTAAVEAERTSRLTAEQESRRIRSDLAALLGVENTEENLGEIRRRTIEATEHFQRKEQAEIEELRSALNKALEELDQSERDAQQAKDRALRAEFDFSKAEEDLLAAKTDLKHITISKEELEGAESARRASLEARISSLERDQISYRRFHTSEIDRLQTELNQIKIERDRLIQNLRHAEERKDAVVGSLKNSVDEGNLESEVRKLRLENAALLAQTAEESARTEKRIREATAARLSADQTQILVERELRLASERELVAANEELAQARRVGSGEHPSAKQKIAELTADLEELRSRTEKLLQEKAEMYRHLEELRHDSRHKHEQLEEDCRQAKHRVAQLEQKGRFEAEVRAEVARIQSSPSLGSKGEESTGRALVQIQSSSNSSDPSTVAHLYDVIKSLEQRMDAERKTYEEEREDMDDLLKLVVQQKLHIESLMSALQVVGGDHAVEDAMDQAYTKAEQQYGQSIRVQD